MKQIYIHAIALLLVVWGGITVTINSNDAYNYRLQNATISALVNRGSFTLRELDVPDFRLIVGQETFRISEDIYPMKQPGQTMLGALIYLPLKNGGIDFEQHYMYTSQLITMYSSALLSAIASLIVAMVAWHVSSSFKIGVLTGLIFVFGTIVWPYAGVTHHDIYGTFLICISLAMYYFARVRGRKVWELWAGVAGSLSLFFTMLTLPLSFVMWGVSKDKKLAGTGVMLGLLPTVIFNLVVFDRAWLVPNLAGKVADTVPLLSLLNLGEKLWFYLGDPLTSLWSYSPILLLGVWGILSLRDRDTWIKRMWLYPVCAQILYISSLETFGGAQYGPRYLIPVIPYLVLGIAIWLRQNRTSWEYAIFAMLLLASCVIALIGALGGVMGMIHESYLPYTQLSSLQSGEIPTLRVIKHGSLMLFLGVSIWLGLALNQRLTKARLRK